jgi:uncharacterized protein
MPVLVESLTLIAASEALRRAGASDSDGQPCGEVARLGARWSCSDGQLTAFAFDEQRPLRWALALLEGAGLPLARGVEPGDLAAVDQLDGPAGWWPWLELAVVGGPEAPRLAARLAGTEGRAVVAPGGWRLAGSATERGGSSPLRPADRPLRHLARELDCDLYQDRWTGELVRLERQHTPVQVEVEGPDGAGGALTVELVTRWPEIEVGLMFREALPPDGGMLFRFDRSARHEFWMKNTLVPLDLLFLGEGGRVVNVIEQAAPRTLAPRPSAGPVREVLEVPGGWCRAHRVGAGAVVRCGPDG